MQAHRVYARNSFCRRADDSFDAAFEWVGEPWMCRNNCYCLCARTREVFICKVFCYEGPRNFPLKVVAFTIWKPIPTDDDN